MDSTVISIVIAVAGIALTIASYFVGRLSAAKAQGKQDGQVLSELGYLRSNTDDIKRRLDKQDERHLEILTRLTQVEASAKQAHRRIDEHLGTRREKD